MTVRLHIERLVVDGLPLTPRDAHGFRERIEAELHAQLSAAPPRAAFSASTLQPAPIAWEPGAAAHVAGDRVGRSIHSVLASGPRTGRATNR